MLKMSIILPIKIMKNQKTFTLYIFCNYSTTAVIYMRQGSRQSHAALLISSESRTIGSAKGMDARD